MKVGELFLALGLIVDDKQWSLGQAVIDKMAADMKRLAVNAVLATTDVKKAMNVIGISAPAKAARKSLADMVKSGDQVTSAFRRMLVAAGGFFAISKVKDMVSETIELGGHINDTAQKTGIAVEELQAWGYAASQNSSSLDEVNDAAVKLARGMDDISKGKGPVVDAFRELGISLDDPAVKSRDLNQILYMVSNKFAAMPDGQKKAALAMDLFGRSGANLIPTLNGGVQAIQAYRDEANELGVVMSGDTISGLDELGDSIDKAKASLVGLRNSAIAALLPTLQRMVTGFQAWITANREVIASTIEKVVSGLATALQLLGSAVAFAVDHWQVFAAILAAGAVYQGLMSIVRLIVFFQAVQTQAALAAVVNWIMILGPILLVAAAVLGLGVLIYKFRDKIKAALGKVADAFKWLGGKIKGAFDGVVDFFKDVGEGIKNAFGAAFDWVVEKAKGVGRTLRNLPVIKQLGDFGAWIGRKAAGDGHASDAEVLQNLWKMDHPNQAYPGDDAARAAYPTAPVSMPAVPATGAGGPTASYSAPRRPAALGAGPTSIQNSYEINIDAKNADAREVASLVDQKLKEHDEMTRRQTAAGLGVA